MASFNKVYLMGNLTRDPELRYTPKGMAVANLSLAINRKYTTETGEAREEVTYVDIQAWGKQAEVISQYCKKGRPLFVEGRLKLEQWDDKATGAKRSAIKVVLEGFQFIGAPPDGQGRPAPSDDDAPPQARRPAAGRPAGAAGAAPADPGTGGDLPPEEDDVPF